MPDYDSRWEEGLEIPKKSTLDEGFDENDAMLIGRSYYMHCLESALEQIDQARMLVVGDPVDDNHCLPTIQTLIKEALQAS